MKQSEKSYIEVLLHDFSESVLKTSYQTPVIVDFWAEWCSPCIVIAPLLERIIRECHRDLVLAKVEVDRGENMKLAGRFSGVKPYHEIEKFIDQHL